MTAFASRPQMPGDEDAIHALAPAVFPTPADTRLSTPLRDAGALTLSLVSEQDGAHAGFDTL